eukprot:TRINITY_DN4181_c0_g1_i1.p1 TRINITY_DN4181_c0_g1~~TRINITY_DN4181_c0_g1_i1.p1  ORF type:complete len:139 (+),score=38.55 TRINITY_DN4181_c0_g1_i1:77-493(+)
MCIRDRVSTQSTWGNQQWVQTMGKGKAKKTNQRIAREVDVKSIVSSKRKRALSERGKEARRYQDSIKRKPIQKRKTKLRSRPAKAPAKVVTTKKKVAVRTRAVAKTTKPTKPTKKKPVAPKSGKTRSSTSKSKKEKSR